MTITTATVDGEYFSPSSPQSAAQLRFDLLGKGIESGAGLVTGSVTATTDGAGAFTVALYAGADANYRVTHLNDPSGQRNLGAINVPVGGPHRLEDLLALGVSDAVAAYTIIPDAIWNGLLPTLLTDSDVQSDSYDTTIGKIAAVGANGLFGLGTDAARLANDLNDLAEMKTGIYAIGNSTLNKPSGWVQGVVLVMRRSGGCQQFGMSNAGNTASRAWGGTSWTSWDSFWTTANAAPDGNGFLIQYSPVLYLSDTDLSWNVDVPEGAVSVTNPTLGEYRIAGTNGLADAGWQVQMPKDQLGNVLRSVAATWDAGTSEIVLEVRDIDWSGGPAAPGALAALPSAPAVQGTLGVTMIRLAEFG